MSVNKDGAWLQHPSSDEEGGRDINENIAKPPLKERTGAERKRGSAQP